MKTCLSLLVALLVAAGAQSQPDPIVGRWDWVDGQELRILADGTLTVWHQGQQINSATWTLTDSARRTYAFRHASGGWVDTVTMSSDLMRLSGRNNRDAVVSGTRIGNPPVQDRPNDILATSKDIGPIHWCLRCGRNPGNRVDYGVTVPEGVRTLIVRVRNGADDGGDLSVELWVDAPGNQRVLSATPDEIGWQEYRITVQQFGDYWITLQDLDTPSDSQLAGNGGSILFQME
jgi:hypothetical protein